MEVTLEKIELVKDRTGVTYKEAKEALEAADGNVVDAIVSIEDKTDGQTSSQKISEKGNELIDKIKEVVQRGNASRIIIRKDDDKLLNLPLNAGVVGAVVAPWGIILGVAAAFGFNCKIEVLKTDGTIVDITDKAGNIYEQAKERGTEVVENVKEKAPSVVDQIKGKGEEVINKAKEKGEEVAGDDTVNDAKAMFGDFVNKAKDAAEKLFAKKDEVSDDAEEAAEDAEEAVEQLADTAEEKKEDLADKAEDIAEEISDADL